ncbi:MAG: Stk1 family PASTA domain-containing Ser/Thr kinase [Bacillota bacterium]
MTGEILGGRYSILDTIGEGGMAIVYRAKDMLLNRVVAIKVLRGQYASDSEFRERFRREAQSAAALSHPNIVNVYDVGEDSGSNYIVMEWVDGQTLNDIIMRDGRLTVDVVADYSVQILDALDHAHRSGVIHRDIKPHNILITRDGRVKVTDFGIARAASASALTEAGQVIGTVNYTSPEQARGASAIAESDIYSLGVVMYEMLTGRLPFVGDTPVAVALKHVQEDALPLSVYNKAVPVEFERVVMKALAKDPQDRWHTARAFKNAILRAHPTEVKKVPDGQQVEDLPTASGSEGAATPHSRITNGVDDDLNITRPFDKVGEAFELENDQETPKRADRQAKTWTTIIVVMLVVAGAVLGALYSFRQWIQVEEVVVPDVVNMTLPDAESLARRSRLALDSSVKRYDNKVEYNRIIEQDPPAGAKRKVHSPIKVIVSLGPEMVTVPDLFNKSEREARLELERSNLVLGAKSQDYHEDVRPGRIVDQEPEVGTYVPRGSTVNYTVSIGPPPPPPEVPLVIGMTLERATDTLKRAGFAVGEVRKRISILYEDGTVIEQNPGPYQMAESGTTIDLVVAQRSGFPSASPSQSDDGGGQIDMSYRRYDVTYQVQPGSEVQEIVIKVNDSYGERTSYGPQLHRPGDWIRHTVEVYGPGKIEVWVDGYPVKTENV